MRSWHAGRCVLFHLEGNLEIGGSAAKLTQELQESPNMLLPYELKQDLIRLDSWESAMKVEECRSRRARIAWTCRTACQEGILLMSSSRRGATMATRTGKSAPQVRGTAGHRLQLH